MINQFFCNCFNLSVPPLSTASEDSGLSEHCPFYLLCSNVEVAKLLLQIPSTGPNGISAHMLRETAYSISSPPTSIFNLLIKSGIFPNDWKNSHIIPIPKHSSALSSPTGYHPISLLPLIHKVLEKHIFNWLLDLCQIIIFYLTLSSALDLVIPQSPPCLLPLTHGLLSWIKGTLSVQPFLI